MDAILYQARTGCSWRQLPGDLPPWSTVYDYFAAWSAEGTKRPQAPIVVDTTGLLLVVLVTAASVQDRDGGRRLLDRVKMAMPSLA